MLVRLHSPSPITAGGFTSFGPNWRFVSSAATVSIWKMSHLCMSMHICTSMHASLHAEKCVLQASDA
ncbi:hypothetical protein DUNSADRAFT_16710 [Dunaliella salina]|uniref:Encoded protein n=1 Tax=Dunaliella salina TaxID=3046 RepID=A0ABQ7G333_DUNSA|nr:hypothetical protein DUNSADRAFT_16710 [Dunaliella salina]|eukprot:KAF5829006.1 hypothetical protein DUNSADRAFT_16710 [Dunaliella salina]